MKVSSYVSWLFALGGAGTAALADTAATPMLLKDPLWHAQQGSESLQVQEASNATTSSRSMIMLVTYEDNEFVRNKIANMHRAFKNNIMVIWDNAESPTCPFEDMKVAGLCLDDHQISKSRRLSHMCCAQEKAFMWAIENRQSFDHIWFIEDDVHATDISELEKVVYLDSSADLLHQSELHPLDESWIYADEVVRDAKGMFPHSEMKTGLLNMFRMSTSFLAALEDVYVGLGEEWFFFEALVPTVAESSQYSLTHELWPQKLEDNDSMYVLTVKPRCITHFDKPGIYHPVKYQDGNFVKCPLKLFAPDVEEGSPYKNQVSKLRSSTINQPPSVHACVGPLGGSTNWHAIAGWVKYHEERWGLTHADIFVLEEEFHVAQDLFDAAGVDSKVALNFNLYSSTNGEAWLANECRANANAGNRDFLIEFEPDRFLVGDSFGSLQDMFDYSDSPDAVAFPTFTNHYEICNSNAMTFASATFVDHLYPSYDRAPSECPREERCLMSDGVTRHFMIREHLGVANLIRFASLAGGKLVGLHEDMSTKTCLQVKECKHVGEDGECTAMDEVALYEQQVTSVNTILSDLSLNAKLKEIQQRAVCYAKRYPSLLDGFCNGDITKCRYGALYDHYVNHGSAENLIWECDHDVSKEIQQLAVCYAQRYPNLFEGFCNGDVNQCRHAEIYHHYVNHGADSNLIFECDREVSHAKSVVRGRRLAAGQEQDEDPLQLYIMLFETDHKRVPDIPLAKQAAAAGISLMTFGAGVEFEGFGTKWGLALSALDDVPPDALVVISDGRDVILNIHGMDEEYGQQTIAGFEQAYRSLTYGKPGAVIMSAEGQCCVSALTYVKPGAYFHPDGTRAERACASGEEGCVWAGDSNRLPWEHMMQELAKETQGEYVRDSYLNAGLVAGRAQDVKRIIELANMETYEDDQAVFTDVLFRWPNLLVLDYAQEMFANMRWTDGMHGGGCNVERDESTPLGGLVHSETQTVPLFLHTPGKFLDCLAHLADDLAITSSPSRTRFLKSSDVPCNYGSCCPLVECDFENLDPNVFLDNPAQADALYAKCGVTVSAIDHKGKTRQVNVFDSTRTPVVKTDDPDLGAPNRECPGGGPGKGEGGVPGAPFANCKPQGNLLIIQDPRATSEKANDSTYGGCVLFEFATPVDVVNLGLLDLEEVTSVSFATAGGYTPLSPYTSDPAVGNNGFWPMDATYPGLSADALEVTAIKICFPGSGGISFLNYRQCPVEPPVFPPYEAPYAAPYEAPYEAPYAAPYEAPYAAPYAAPYSPPYAETESPTATPTAAPTTTPCTPINCDFDTLVTGVALSDPAQAQRLYDACYLKVVATNTIANNELNIFNSKKRSSQDPDLGSPNNYCPGGGPGRGRGGRPTAEYPNCESQGKILIIQNELLNITTPNDSKFGGCFEFTFKYPVNMKNIALLDIDDGDAAEISFNGDPLNGFLSPTDVGNNGYWPANKTNPEIVDYTDVTQMSICLVGSGAVTSLQYEICAYPDRN